MSDVEEAIADMKRARASLIHALAPIAVYIGEAANAGDPAMRLAIPARKRFVQGHSLVEIFNDTLADTEFWRALDAFRISPDGAEQVAVNSNRTPGVHTNPESEAA